MTSLEELCAYARSFYNLEYVWGGNNPYEGFDCSGLVCELLRAGGAIGTEDYKSQQLYDHFRNSWPSCEPRRGAIAFFGLDSSPITHVAFCVSSSLMLEAGGGAQRTATKFEARKINARVRLRPITSRRVLGFLYPEYCFKGDE